MILPTGGRRSLEVGDFAILLHDHQEKLIKIISKESSARTAKIGYKFINEEQEPVGDLMEYIYYDR